MRAGVEWGGWVSAAVWFAEMDISSVLTQEAGGRRQAEGGMRRGERAREQEHTAYGMCWMPDLKGKTKTRYKKGRLGGEGRRKRRKKKRKRSGRKRVHRPAIACAMSTATRHGCVCPLDTHLYGSETGDRLKSSWTCTQEWGWGRGNVQWNLAEDEQIM